MEMILTVAFSVLASMFVTKIQTAKYFDVIDGYVKGLISDIKSIISNTA